MNKRITIIHQGDILLVNEEKLPNDLRLKKGMKPRKDRTLALGESSGHHHTMTGGVVCGTMGGLQWVVAEQPEQLQHLPDPGVEHNTVPVPVGIWFVPVQVEDDGEKERRAMD